MARHPVRSLPAKGGTRASGVVTHLAGVAVGEQPRFAQYQS